MLFLVHCKLSYTILKNTLIIYIVINESRYRSKSSTVLLDIDILSKYYRNLNNNQYHGNWKILSQRYKKSSQ